MYMQPVKAQVRTRLLQRAIGALTVERSESAIVRRNDLQEIVDFAISRLRGRSLPATIVDDVKAELRDWSTFDATRLGNRSAQDLNVLYLCGPEPLNDASILFSHGVSPHNTWAVTSSAADLTRAVTQLDQSQTHVKIHHGSLAEFLEVVPQVFDIIYVDANGPFGGGQPNSLAPIIALLTQGRLSPLAVLITSYCEPPADLKALDRYVDAITAYFRYRYRDLPREAHTSGLDPEINQHDPRALEDFVRKNVALVYSEFITKVVVELADYLIPSCRALSIKSIFETLVVSVGNAKQAYDSAVSVAPTASSVEELVRLTGDTALSPSSYPLLSFFEQLRRIDAPLGSQLGNVRLNGREVGKLLGVASLLDRVIEGHWDCLSEKFLQAVKSSWFDASAPFSCDVPMPNLLVNSVLGQYGRPCFVNPERSVRLSYQAKQNTMYCDLLVLDQCRSYFDWWPTIDLLPSRFRSYAFQVLARCIIDRISWHGWQRDSHPFRGGAVACIGEVPCARPYDFAPRETVSAER